MEIIIALVLLIVVGALVYYNRHSRNFDVNQDGKVNVQDLSQAVTNVADGVKESADVNNDGKIDSNDADAVVKVVAAEAKKTATKARSAIKKTTTRSRKPKA
jgi:Ca2+-binding EF-hand superfamily protein